MARHAAPRACLAIVAELFVAIYGEVMTMPGLPRIRASEAVSVNTLGQIEVLF